MEIAEILHLSPVIPVVTLQDVRDAIPLAKTLIAAGVSVLEITLRTDVGLEAIKTINENVPAMLVGAGTVLEPEQFQDAKRHGARFAVSPGITPRLINAAKQIGIPYLPGAVTSSEIMAAREMGFPILKFFPAELSGGIKMLKALAPIFPEIQFCPTGGITRSNMKEYLQLENVISVGGSWIAPENLIKEKKWEEIGILAKEIIRDI